MAAAEALDPLGSQRRALLAERAERTIDITFPAVGVVVAGDVRQRLRDALYEVGCDPGPFRVAVLIVAVEAALGPGWNPLCAPQLAALLLSFASPELHDGERGPEADRVGEALALIQRDAIAPLAHRVIRWNERPYPPPPPPRCYQPRVARERAHRPRRRPRANCARAPGRPADGDEDDPSDDDLEPGGAGRRGVQVRP
jgi:hypothetical protein